MCSLSTNHRSQLQTNCDENCAPLIYFCRITEDSEYSEARFSYLELVDDSFYQVISYEGKIYFLTYHIRFGGIDFDINNPCPTLTTLGVLNHYSHSWYTTTE